MYIKLGATYTFERYRDIDSEAGNYIEVGELSGCSYPKDFFGVFGSAVRVPKMRVVRD